LQHSEVFTLVVGTGATIWLTVVPPRRAKMRLLLGLIAIAFLVYGTSGVILENVDMKIPLWAVIIIGGLVGSLAAGLAWKEAEKS